MDRNSGGVNSDRSKRQDRTSLDSTITDTEESQPVHVSYSQTESEISLIHQQLLEIAKKQSSLMDILQVNLMHFLWIFRWLWLMGD